MYAVAYQMQAAALLGWQTQQLHQTLAQVLHETETDARRVAATMPHDPFAAAVLARAQLNRVASVNATSFPDIHTKRSWDWALAELQRAARPQDPRVASDVDGYCSRMDRLAAYQRHMGGDDRRYVATLREKHASTFVWWGWLAAAGATVLGTIVFAGLASAGRAKAGPIGSLIVVGGIMASVFGAGGWRAYDARRRAARDLAAGERFFAEYHAFWNDPNGGGVLARAWKEHRLLTETPPDLPPSSQAPAVIERQLVVTRCKYCSKHTQMDLPTCQHCGAPGFAGAR